MFILNADLALVNSAEEDPYLLSSAGTSEAMTDIGAAEGISLPSASIDEILAKSNSSFLVYDKGHCLSSSYAIEIDDSSNVACFAVKRAVAYPKTADISTAADNEDEAALASGSVAEYISSSGSQ